MPQDLADDESTLVQVMAWCHQATSHYLNQCWPRSPTPYEATRPQWVNKEASMEEIWGISCWTTYHSPPQIWLPITPSIFKYAFLKDIFAFWFIYYYKTQTLCQSDWNDVLAIDWGQARIIRDLRIYLIPHQWSMNFFRYMCTSMVPCRAPKHIHCTSHLQVTT